jgi:hypothetical protein
VSASSPVPMIAMPSNASGTAHRSIENILPFSHSKVDPLARPPGPPGGPACRVHSPGAPGFSLQGQRRGSPRRPGTGARRTPRTKLSRARLRPAVQHAPKTCSQQRCLEQPDQRGPSVPEEAPAVSTTRIEGDRRALGRRAAAYVSRVRTCRQRHARSLRVNASLPAIARPSPRRTRPRRLTDELLAWASPKAKRERVISDLTPPGDALALVERRALSAVRLGGDPDDRLRARCRWSAAIAPDHAGPSHRRAPRNTRQRYPADPPTVEEIIAVMRQTADDPHGARLRH